MFKVEDGYLDSFRSITLQDDAANSSAVIVPGRGALATSLFAYNREWLYLDRATFADSAQNVRGGIPVLFPIAGKLENDRYTYEAHQKTMRQHGFARTLSFKETKRGTDSSAWTTLELVSNDTTRAVFPWEFRFSLTFKLHGASLSICADVENTGTETMPFVLGYHPYFSVLHADKNRSRIPTNATRAWENITKTEVHLKKNEIRFDVPEVDLHLIDHSLNIATLEIPNGSIELQGNVSRWIIWTLPDRDFICLEPWTALSNALNSGEGLIELPRSQTHSLELIVTVGQPH